MRALWLARPKAVLQAAELTCVRAWLGLIRPFSHEIPQVTRFAWLNHGAELRNPHTDDDDQPRTKGQAMTAGLLASVPAAFGAVAVARPFWVDWPDLGPLRDVRPATLRVCRWLSTAGIVSALRAAVPSLRWQQTYGAVRTWRRRSVILGA
jgi:hypothetical protein